VLLKRHLSLLPAINSRNINMLNFLKIGSLVCAALLAGCAATVQQGDSRAPKLQVPTESSKKLVMVVKGSDISSRSADWELLRAEWRTGMSAAASDAGLGFSYLETLPQFPSEPGTAVVVTVNDYRYISPGARYGFGVLTGNAFVQSDVEFIDMQTGQSEGSRKYETSSSAWEGVFSAMTEKQIQAICTRIVMDVKKQ
jgi:hypothetical protein